MKMKLQLIQKPSLKLKQIPKDYGILGKLVSNMYYFIQNNRDMNLPIFDHINGKEILAKEYFKENKTRFIVNNEQLPFDLDIKGAYINKKVGNANRPIIQSSEIDFSALEKMLTEVYGELLELKGKTIYSSEKNKIIETSTAIMRMKGKYVKRSTIIAIPLFKGEHNVDLAIKVIDSLYDNNLFKKDEEIGKNTLVPKLKMKQTLTISGSMKDQQKLSFAPQQNLYQKLNAEIMAAPIQELAQKIKATNEEVEEILTEENIEDPLITKYYDTRKKIIFKIKRAKPNFTWKQATKMCNHLILKGLK